MLRAEAYGVPFEVEVDDRRLLPQVRVRLPPRAAPTEHPPAVLLALVHEVVDAPGLDRAPAPRVRWQAPRRGLSVRVAGERVAWGLDHALALDVLESELQLSVARLARPEVFVHAGVVAVAGRAILLPGTSGAGKTTLVRALVDAGATYYSDEYAVLDAEGRVHPYPRRPSVRVRSGRKERHPVPRVRGRGPLPVALVVETRYRREGRWSPAPLTPGECVLALLANTVPARDRPGEVLATLARATAGARGFRSERGPASRTARALIALARAQARGVPDRRAGPASGRRPRGGSARTVNRRRASR